MKTTTISFLLAISFALSSCRSFSYFESPNNLRNIEGTLYLQNGKVYTGKLIIQTEGLFSSPVKLYTEEDTKPMQFRLHDVKGYDIRGSYYELKEIREALSIGKRQLFMKRLTPEDSRLHLFEFMRKEIVNKTATRYHSEHYMQLPGEEERLVFATDGAAFVPNFEKKISSLVSDCPPLAQKIAAKEHGYYYHQVSLLKEKRLDVLRRIIDEYNQCDVAKPEM